MLEDLEICLAGEVLDLVRPWFELSVHKDRRGIGRWCEIHGDGKLGVFELARRRAHSATFSPWVMDHAE